MQKLLLSKASIVGLSLGAWMSVSYAVNHPSKIEKLVLLSPSGIGSQRVSFLFKAIPWMLMGDIGIDKITQLVNSNQPLPPEAIEYTKLIARNFNLRTETVPIFKDEELKQLTMPLLLYCGEKDVLLNSHQTIKRIKELLPNASTNLLHDYGHVLIGLTDRIINFLNSNT
ncbi:MAG: hypothetical protein CVU87_04875 [Firmicutes bacterium HGW-Firmicutes-12]|jgi:pimeloyl-ACP methyl ester carboxylesterase|nr:MAG: hypothetical protein CVU87_04875 [Firmicutes bacterium HGW-Firmicutes-12]